MKRVLITGGAGFVGSSIAIALKKRFENIEVIALDNLYRKGSELNLPILEQYGVQFIQGDVRNPADIASAGNSNLVIECSAEPSVTAGCDSTSSTNYLIETNLNGALNCAEYCRKNGAEMIFLSTSRVYPMAHLIDASITETETRFELDDDQKIKGLSRKGVSESMPMDGVRSLYGATKYSAEIMLTEYRHAFSMPLSINRCGVIAGPGQFGKDNQGIAAFWTAAHILKRPLRYIGFGGTGKQVRDMIHIDDLIELLMLQVSDIKPFTDSVFNVGGGEKISTSLLELTSTCQEVTGNTLEITAETETRYADIPIYISDCTKLSQICQWQPKLGIKEIVSDIHNWITTTPTIKAFFTAT